MTEKETTKLSKFLSLVLRHQPETIGLQLDANGWAPVDRLFEQMIAHGHSITPEQLQHVVDTNSKKRFAFSEDGLHIRASQGHSVEVDLDYQPTLPPAVLYHGTAVVNVAAILQQGLEKRSRHHVHLSADKATALQVGWRHGKPQVLVVDAGRMQQDGYQFYLSANGVWLTDAVPAAYIIAEGTAVAD